MFNENFQFHGFSASAWLHLLGLLGHQPEARSAPRLIVIEGEPGVAIAAFSTTGNVVDISEYTGAACLESLCQRHGCRGAIMLRDGLISDAVESASSQLGDNGDLLDLLLCLLTEMRTATLRGNLVQYPASRGLPTPTAAVVRRAVDHILPDNTCMVVGVWDRHSLWTGVVLRRRDGHLDLCAGPDAIAEWVGPLGGDFHRDHRSITRAVSRIVAPVHLGLYAERDQLQNLLRNPLPGAWLKSVALREVVFDPSPAYVGAALGADGARAAADHLKTLLGGFDAFQKLQPYFGAFRDQLGSLSSVTRTLGFNPLEQLANRLNKEG